MARSEDGHLRQRDYAVFWLSAALAAATSGVLGSIDPDAFERYFGQFHPVLVVAVAAVAGVVSVRFLEARKWWSARPSDEVRRGLLVSTLAALAFAILAISIDVWFGFPEDINVLWPDSLLFYPAIAFVAEFVFHILPLALLVAVTGWHFTDRGFSRLVWAGVMVVALVEAGFQVVIGSSLRFFLGPHLFAIGVYELLALRRFGYIPMIWFRLVYYLVWHVVWGYARLELLF